MSDNKQQRVDGKEAWMMATAAGVVGDKATYEAALRRTRTRKEDGAGKTLLAQTLEALEADEGANEEMLEHLREWKAAGRDTRFANCLRYHAKAAYSPDAAANVTSRPLLLENGGATQGNTNGAGNDDPQFGTMVSGAAFPAGSGNGASPGTTLTKGRAEGWLAAIQVRSNEEAARREQESKERLEIERMRSKERLETIKILTNGNNVGTNGSGNQDGPPPPVPAPTPAQQAFSTPHRGTQMTHMTMTPRDCEDIADKIVKGVNSKLKIHNEDSGRGLNQKFASADFTIIHDIFDHVASKFEKEKLVYLEGCMEGARVVKAISYVDPRDAMGYLPDVMRGKNTSIAEDAVLRIGTDTRTDALIKAEYVDEDVESVSDAFNGIGNEYSQFWGLFQQLCIEVVKDDEESSVLYVLLRDDPIGAARVAGYVMEMLSTLILELGIQRINISVGAKNEEPAPLPLSIELLGLEKMDGVTINFQFCIFDAIQAKQLAAVAPASMMLKMETCVLPLDGNGNNVFLQCITDRNEGIKLWFHKNLPVVGTKVNDMPSRIEAGLGMMANLARDGLISSLHLDTDHEGGPVFGYQALVAYKKLHKVLGDNLCEPDELRAVSQQGDTPVLVKLYHKEDLPVWRPAQTQKGTACKKCDVELQQYCKLHKSKAEDILSGLGISTD